MPDRVFYLQSVKHLIQIEMYFLTRQLKDLSDKDFDEFKLADRSYIFLIPITLWVKLKLVFITK